MLTILTVLREKSKKKKAWELDCNQVNTYICIPIIEIIYTTEQNKHIDNKIDITVQYIHTDYNIDKYMGCRELFLSTNRRVQILREKRKEVKKQRKT